MALGRVGILVDPTSISNILEIKQASATDPIADSWTTHPSNRKFKDIISEDISLLDGFRKIKTYRYKRKSIVTEDDIDRHIDRQVLDTLRRAGLNSKDVHLFDRSTPNDFLNTDALREKFLREQKDLPKFTAERVGIFIDDPNTPDEILTKDDQGNVTGIDLLGYVGYLHNIVKELTEEVYASRNT